MSPAPRVTIGVTTYNTGRYPTGAFDDLLAQELSDFEVVVCDNCSTDNTREICGASGFPHRDRIATIGRFIVVWPASRVRIRLGAWRRHIGARCAGSARPAVG